MTGKPWVKQAGLALLAVAACFAIYLYGKVDPATAPFPKCPFFWATGLKCPGCGTQRALHQLLHLDIGAAFHYNACLVAFIPVLLFLSVAGLFGPRCPRLRAFLRHPALPWILVALIFLWWVLRNVFGW